MIWQSFRNSIRRKTEKKPLKVKVVCCGACGVRREEEDGNLEVGEGERDLVVAPRVRRNLPCLHIHFGDDVIGHLIQYITYSVVSEGHIEA